MVPIVSGLGLAKTAITFAPSYPVAQQLGRQTNAFRTPTGSAGDPIRRSSASRKVSSTCLVTVARNRYSVPCEWAGQMVSTRLYPAQIVVVAGDTVVATHERLSDRNQTRYDWQHYVPLIERKPGALRNGAPFEDLPAPLQRMRQALVHQDGGDKVMAQVLAEVPKQGLDTVLVAVELALESAPPSGRVSTEHVINVLTRLQAQTMPQSVATTLQVRQAPLADTARYDSLRASQVQEADHA